MSLYPPIVDTYAPAFIMDTNCAIKYYYSPYQDSPEQIIAIHVIVQEQNTNFSVLDTSKYPMGIKEISNPNGEIIIEPSDIAEGFKNNKYYKVQLRFSTVLSPEGKIMSSFLNNNLSNFSEWSTVCLIRAISKPTLNFENFSTSTSSSIRRLENGTGYLRGQLSFEDSLESEYLKSYQIKIYEGESINNQNLVLDTGIIYTDSYSPNTFSYLYNINLIEGITYLLDFNYTTNNLYQGIERFIFSLAQYRFKYPEGSLTIIPKFEQGYIELTFKSAETSSFFGNIMIQRTSSDSNFNYWEDVHSFAITADNTKGVHTWIDYTAEAGVLYKYRYQHLIKEDNEIVRSEPSLMFSAEHESIEKRLTYQGTYTPSIQDIFLYDGKSQLRVQYDPNISSFKKVVMDSKSETLGAQYPFIVRNAKVGYRQFSLSGLISYNMDLFETYDFNPDPLYADDGSIVKQHQGFTADEKILPFLESNLKNKDAFKVYLKNLPVFNSDFNEDIYLERKFREIVLDFLCNDKVKLFKSETEGNILVRLMDVSLTPNQQLGRKVYSFSATAYEIAAPTFENYRQYGLLQLNDYVDNLDSSFSKVGQLIFEMENNEKINIIENLISKEKYESSKVSQSIVSFDMIQITFTGKPYSIDLSNYTIMNTFEESKSYIMGYLLQINGNYFITYNPVFVLTKEDIDMSIDNLTISAFGPVEVNYIANIANRIKKENDLIPDISYQVVGQLWDVFEPISNNVITQLAMKYNVNADTYYTKLVAVNGIHIEANPGARIRIMDYWDFNGTQENKVEHLHIIGPTGSLTFYDKDNIIKSLYFDGIRLVPAFEGVDFDPEINKYDRQPREVEYKIYSQSFQSIDEIKNPILNMVYNVAGNYKIYYQGEWYSCTFEEITSNNTTVKFLYIPCKISALVDYFIEVGEGDYS